MIVKNEEDCLASSLNSIFPAVDEIIIVDTGSYDQTKAIAKKYTNKVFDFEWIDDFSSARNYSFSKATSDYILWLDADDIFLRKDYENFVQLKQKLTDEDVVMMRYNTVFNNKNECVFWFFRERLVKNSPSLKWKERVHEYLEIQGKIIFSDIAITHNKTKPKTDRNILIYEKQLKSSSLSPRGIYYYARELFEHKRYNEAIERFEEFLRLPDGWHEDKIEACLLLSVLYEIKDEPNNVFKSLFKSFSYAPPRPKICNALARYYRQQNNLAAAENWLKLSKTTTPSLWEFQRKD